MQNYEENIIATRRIAADPFRPHEFRTQLVHNFTQPKIFVTLEAYGDMLAIAENSGSDEIGWLGTVTELGNGKFLIDGIAMPAQQVHGATCELTEDGLGEFFTELATTDFDACERMHFWGHVHPGNSTSPSSQDEEQMNLFKHNDWFVRGIFGRNGRAEFTFFDFKSGIRWNDVSWSIYCPVDESRRAKWATEIAAKVKKIAIHNEFGLGGYSPFAPGPSQTVLPAGKGRKVTTKRRRQYGTDHS